MTLMAVLFSSVSKNLGEVQVLDHVNLEIRWATLPLFWVRAGAASRNSGSSRPALT